MQVKEEAVGKLVDFARNNHQLAGKAAKPIASKLNPAEETQYDFPRRILYSCYLFYCPCHVCTKSLFCPLAKTSVRLGPQDTAAGALVKLPPRDSQLSQREPFQVLL